MFDGHGFHNIPPEILAKALTSLESISISSYKDSFTSEQLICFFKQLAKKSSLDNLHIRFYNSRHHNLLASIPSDVLSEGKKHLRSVKIPFFNVSNRQMEKILKTVSENSSKIRTIQLGLDNITDINLDILVSVEKSEKLDAISTLELSNLRKYLLRRH